MANTGVKGSDSRQSGTALIFRAFLQDSTGAILATGTTTYTLDEMQSDGTIKSYDFNDNTFKTTALTTATASMTHRPRNNAGTNTGLWTAALSTLTGFTRGAMYIVQVTNTGASPAVQTREFEYGDGDISIDSNGRLDVIKIAGTTQTARDIGASVIVGTNNDKTGYGLSSAAVQAVWDALTSALTTSGSIGKWILDKLDATISSRMASYTQPTGFLAATFPGTVASPTNITAGTITTVTNLTNAPTNGDLTATMKDSVASAILVTPVNKLATDSGGVVDGNVVRINGSLTDGSESPILSLGQLRIVTNISGEGAVHLVNSGSGTYGILASGTASDFVLGGTGFINGGLTGAIFLSDGSITSGTIADGAFTPAKFGTDAIGAASVSAGAVTKIQSGLATAAALTTVGTNVSTLISRIGAFAGSGVNTVLGFLKAALSKVASTPSDVGGTFDPATDSLEAIRDNQAAGADPLLNAVPGSYAAGTAGFVLGTNLNAAISSRATQTSVDAIAAANPGTVEDIAQALAGTVNITVLSSVTGSTIDVVKGQTVLATTITKQGTETHWPTTLSTVELFAVPTADTLATYPSAASLTAISMTVTQATGASQAFTFTLTAAQTDTLTAAGVGSYEFRFVANRSTFPVPIRSGSMTVRRKVWS